MGFKIAVAGIVGILRRDTVEEGLIGLLPHTGQGIDMKPGPKMSGFIPPHVCALKLRADRFRKDLSTKKPDLRYSALDGVEYVLFKIDLERVSIGGVADGPARYRYTPVDPDKPETCTSTEATKMELQWVPNIKLAEYKKKRSVGVFNQAKYLESDFKPKPHTGNGLAGVLVMDRGEIFVSSIRKEYEFRVPGKSEVEWKQSVFETLTWEVKPSGNVVRFVFDSEGGDSSTVAMDTSGDAGAEIACREVESMIGFGEIARRNASDRIDFDSSIFYRFMSKVPSEAEGMPLPHVPGSSRPGGSALCIPMMLG